MKFCLFCRNNGLGYVACFLWPDMNEQEIWSIIVYPKKRKKENNCLFGIIPKLPTSPSPIGTWTFLSAGLWTFDPPPKAYRIQRTHSYKNAQTLSVLFLRLLLICYLFSRKPCFLHCEALCRRDISAIFLESYHQQMIRYAP